MPYFIEDNLNCCWGLLLPTKQRIHCRGYSNISILGLQHQIEQPFLIFVILPQYFCSDFSYLEFSYVLLYCYYSGVAIFYDVMKFEFTLFMEGDFFKILVYYFISIVYLYQTITPIFLHCTVMFFNIFFSYYISLCLYHYYFTSIFIKNRRLYQSNHI